MSADLFEHLTVAGIREKGGDGQAAPRAGGAEDVEDVEEQGAARQWRRHPEPGSQTNL